MTHTPYEVLFLCTGNSARSILAEAITNNLSITQGKFRGFSAGSHPKDEINPFAIDVLKHSRMLTDGLRSKSWDEFTQEDAPKLDFVLRFVIRSRASNVLIGRVSR